MITVVKEAMGTLAITHACSAVGLCRATFYRHVQPKANHPRRRRVPKQALSVQEQQRVLDVLHEDRFVDLAPTEVFAQLLDEGIYLCSPRTMYRILARNEEVRERRRQRQHVPYSKPELLATGPNQVWSWDITKLRGPGKWQYFYLYVVLDIFSRYVVGWLIADRESKELAQRLLSETCAAQNVAPHTLVIHSDRGSVMKSKTLAQTLGLLGVTQSYSRPHVSDDNPFSEAQYKTLKYRPDFPQRFDSIEHAEHHCRDFFGWYNHEHHHVGLGLMTPNDVHHGLALQRWHARARTLAAAYQAHPERYPNGAPTPPPLPTEVWINKPTQKTAPAESADQRAHHGAQDDAALAEHDGARAVFPLNSSQVLTR